MNTKILINNSMVYGAILGFATVLLQLIFYFIIGIPSAGILEFVLLIFCVIIGTKKLRRSFNSLDSLSGFKYSSGLLSAIYIGFFSGIIIAAFYILMIKIDPEIIDRIITKTQEALLNFGMNEDKVEELTKVTGEQFTAIALLINRTLQEALKGLIVGLFSAAFLKKEPSLFNNTEEKREIS